MLAPIFPIVIGLIAYSIAWTTGLARFDPQPLIGRSCSYVNDAYGESDTNVSVDIKGGWARST